MVWLRVNWTGVKIIYMLQIFWLVLGTITYFIFGSISYILEDHTIRNSDFIKSDARTK